MSENPALEEGAEEINEDDRDDDYDDQEKDNSDEDFDLSEYLDDDSPDYKTSASNHSKDDEDRVVPLSSGQSFQERLTEQLHLLDLDDKEFMIADTIIGNLDESGYLSRDVEALVDDLAFAANIECSEAEIIKILKWTIRHIKSLVRCVIQLVIPAAQVIEHRILIILIPKGNSLN